MCIFVVTNCRKCAVFIKRDRYSCPAFEKDDKCHNTTTETKTSEIPCSTCVIEDLRKAAEEEEAEIRHMKTQNENRGGGQGQDKRRWI